MAARFQALPLQHWRRVSVRADTDMSFEAGKYNRVQFDKQGRPGKPGHIPLAAPRTRWPLRRNLLSESEIQMSSYMFCYSFRHIDEKGGGMVRGEKRHSRFISCNFFAQYNVFLASREGG